MLPELRGFLHRLSHYIVRGFAPFLVFVVPFVLLALNTVGWASPGENDPPGAWVRCFLYTVILTAIYVGSWFVTFFLICGWNYERASVGAAVHEAEFEPCCWLVIGILIVFYFSLNAVRESILLAFLIVLIADAILRTAVLAGGYRHYASVVWPRIEESMAAFQQQARERFGAWWQQQKEALQRRRALKTLHTYYRTNAEFLRDQFPQEMYRAYLHLEANEELPAATIWENVRTLLERLQPLVIEGRKKQQEELEQVADQERKTGGLRQKIRKAQQELEQLAASPIKEGLETETIAIKREIRELESELENVEPMKLGE